MTKRRKSSYTISTRNCTPTNRTAFLTQRATFGHPQQQEQSETTTTTTTTPFAQQQQQPNAYRHSTLGNGNPQGQPSFSSIQLPSSPYTAMTLTLDVGSRYENHTTAGINHFLSSLLLADPAHREYATSRGFNVEVSAHREQLQITVSNRTPLDHVDNNHNVGEMMKFLFHIIGKQHSTFDTTSAVNFEKLQEDYFHNVLTTHVMRSRALQLDELTHTTAFNNHGLGQSLYTPHCADLKAFKAQTNQSLVQEWYKATYTRNRMSLSAVNVLHADYMKHAEELIDAVPNSSIHTIPTPRTAYRGGTRLVGEKKNADSTTTTLSFLGPHFHHPHAPHAQIINTIINTTPTLSDSITSSNFTSYSDAALLTLSQQQPNDLEEMVGRTKDLLTNLINQTEVVTAAQQVLTQQITQHFATPTTTSQFLGKHNSYLQTQQRKAKQPKLITTPEMKVDPIAQFLENVNAVTPQDTAKTMQHILQSPPTIVVL